MDRNPDGASRSSHLAALLRRTPELERLELICRMATSARSIDRAATARALADGVCTVGATSVIEHLARDPIAEVRAASALAAAHRYPEAPDRYAKILDQLASDSDRRVSCAASSDSD